MASILYISYDGMTDPLGQSQVLPYLRGLSALGHNITLLSCEKAERASGKDFIAQLCAEYKIDWQPIDYTRKPPILSTIKDVRKIKQTAAALHHKKHFDIVHCRSYIAAIAGQWMKQKFDVPFIFDMRGFWADERVDGNLWQLSNPLYNTVYKYFKRKEKEFLEQADSVVSLTHAAKEEILEWPLLRKPEIEVIPCCVDTQLFAPEKIDASKQQESRTKAALPGGKKILGYVGSLGTWYLLSEMLQFYKEWLRAQPESILFFVTTEPKETIFSQAAQMDIPADAIRVVSAGRTEVPYYISLMDYGIFFIKQAFSKKASSPVKQGELMAMGVPVICNAGVGDSDKIIHDYQSGLLVNNYTPDAFQQTIATLPNHKFDPTAIREGCFDYFDLDKGIQSYARIYQKLSPAK